MAATDDRLLTAAEEIHLAKRIDRGDLVARRAMIERNLRLVYSLAQRYRGRGAAYDDLVQEGTIGLVRAVEKFDHRRGLKFSTYAVWWIRRSLANAVVDARTISPARGVEFALLWRDKTAAPALNELVSCAEARAGASRPMLAAVA